MNKIILTEKSAKSLGLIKQNPDMTWTLASGDYIISSNCVKPTHEDVVIEELEKSFNMRNWKLSTPKQINLKFS